MLWGTSEMVNARGFHTCAIVFRTPQNLLVETFGALGMTGSHFLSRNVFWENAVGVSQKQCMLEIFKSLPLCSAPLYT